MADTDLSASKLHQRNAEQLPQRRTSETGSTPATKRELPSLGVASDRLTEDSTMTIPTSANGSSVRFETRSEFERALHQLGLPKSAARKLVAGGWPALSREQPADHRPQPSKEISQMSIQDLRERRAAKHEEIQAIISKKDWKTARDQPIVDACYRRMD